MFTGKKWRIILAGISLLLAGVVQAATPDRPNVLLILTDQQFADAMSCAGNEYVKTPVMDGIAERGIRFEKAYCSYPLCTPSRSHMFTGVQGEKKRRNLSDYECIGLTMKKAGYDTGYTGKWHIKTRITEQDWSGFDFLAETRGPRSDPRLAKPCREFISKKRDKPFFLVASYHNPHDICSVARVLSGNSVEREYNPEKPGLYYNGPIGTFPPAEKCPPLPKNFHIPENESEIIRQHQREPKAAAVFPTIHWKDHGKWRQYLWAYYRMCEMVDAEIGKVITALKDTGQLDNTLIIFAADHGDGLAAHQWNQKQVLYDETTRVPFIISHPKTLPQNKVDKTTLVNTGLDMATTIFNAAGVKPNTNQFGQPLYDICTGKSDARHDYIVSETILRTLSPKEKLYHGRMVRTPKYKYVVFDSGDQPEMLFDMDKDLGELNNLAPNPKYASEIIRHRNLLKQWIKKNNEKFALPPAKASM